MNNLFLKTIFIGSAYLFLSFASFANDQQDLFENNYDRVYEECNEIVVNQSTDDNWQEMFNECMKNNGFNIENESSDMHLDEMPDDSQSW